MLALVGFFGQTTARAMPMQALATEQAVSSSLMTPEHCAEMGKMAAAADEPPAETPCKTMTGECIGKMGCAVAVIEPALPAAEVVPVRYQTVAYRSSSESRRGLSVPPELFPPIALS